MVLGKRNTARMTSLVRYDVPAHDRSKFAGHSTVLFNLAQLPMCPNRFPTRFPVMFAERELLIVQASDRGQLVECNYQFPPYYICDLCLKAGRSPSDCHSVDSCLSMNG